MPFVFHLGVIDKPYSVSAPRRLATKMRRGQKTVTKVSAPAAGAQTTLDVARYLEARYHVFEVFAELHREDIAKSIAGTMKVAIDHVLQTGRAPDRIFPAEGQGDLQKIWNDFIDLREMDGVQPGVPTGAAKRGVNHALGTKRGPERPSFKDTGQYRGDARFWVDEK